MSYETEKIRLAIVRARLCNDPHFSVDIPHDQLVRLFTELYMEYWIYWITRRELAELTDYMIKTGMAPHRDFKQAA